MHHHIKPAEGSYIPLDIQQQVEEVLRPPFSYDGEVYWGSLPRAQRWKFVSSIDKVEVRTEIGQLFPCWKRPWSVMTKWRDNCFLPGAGIYLESFIIMSWGTLKMLFQQYDPACFQTYETCSKSVIHATTFAMMGAIMFGQVVMGVAADWIGRYIAMVINAIIMGVALMALAAYYIPLQYDWIFSVFIVICFIFYGIGVGGEYPITATQAMERNSALRGYQPQRTDALHRGRGVNLTFSMQGWGNFSSQVLCLALFLIFQHFNMAIEPTTQLVFRIPFILICAGTFWLAYHRYKTGKSSAKALEQSKAQANIKGYDIHSIPPLFKHCWHRLLATCLLWFLCDVIFYGVKLHQAEVLKPMLKDPNDFSEMMGLNIQAIAVGLLGYHVAALTVDSKFYGRRVQVIVGNIICSISMFLPWLFNDWFTVEEGLPYFRACYLVLTFFTQFGSNCVTFLVAAELFPTNVRATAHGMAAMFGKLGALLVGIALNYLHGRDVLLIIWIPCLISVAVAVIFLPDTTGLDLREQDRRWRYIISGHAADYHGPAVHPVHLSLWERQTGIGHQYDGRLDFDSRLLELTQDWDTHKDDVDDFPEALRAYFSYKFAYDISVRLLAVKRESDSSDSETRMSAVDVGDTS